MLTCIICRSCGYTLKTSVYFNMNNLMKFLAPLTSTVSNSANIICVSFYKLMDESNYDFVPLADVSLSCDEPRPVWTLFNFLNNYPWSNYA